MGCFLSSISLSVVTNAHVVWCGYLLCICVKPHDWARCYGSIQSLALKDLRMLYIVRLYNDSRSPGLHIPFKVSQNAHWVWPFSILIVLQYRTCKIHKTKQVWVSAGQSNLCPNVYMEGCKLKCYWPRGLTGSDKSITGRRRTFFCCF